MAFEGLTEKLNAAFKRLRGKGRLTENDGLLIHCALITRYVQLLSGFVGTVGWSCWSCFTIVEMSCNLDSETDRIFLGEGISFVDRESL